MKNLIISVTLLAGTLAAAGLALPTGNLAADVITACAGAAAPKPPPVTKPVKARETGMCMAE